MPTIPGVTETFEKLTRLHKTKNDDYTGDKGAFYNFEFAEYLSSLFKHGRDKVYAVMIGIKLARLSIVLSKPPSHESVEDTFDDAIVYLTIWKSDYHARHVKQDIHERVDRVTIRETPTEN